MGAAQLVPAASRSGSFARGRAWCVSNVRLTCPPEVTGLAELSQRCLGKFASAAYKDSRAPQNLYPSPAWNVNCVAASATPRFCTAPCVRPPAPTSTP